MLTSLPKLADRNFVVGFLLPTVLTALALAAILRDVQPVAQVWSKLQSDKSLADITLLVIGVWSVAVLMMVLNHSMYRVLEGYYGPFNRKAWRDQLSEEHRKTKQWLRDQHNAIEKARAAGSAKATAESRAYFLRRYEFNRRFPSRQHLVLPTKFGNAIRAFERYPFDAYGVESIPVWLRLSALVSKDYRALLDDARSQVDFFVNLIFFATLIAVLCSIRAFLELVLLFWPGHSVLDVLLLALAASLSAVTAGVAYEGAVARSIAWGDLVRGAFDLYLPDLARQLGYDLPASSRKRREFWDAVNSMLLYGAPMIPERWTAAPASPKDLGDDGEAPHEDDDADDDG